MIEPSDIHQRQTAFMTSRFGFATQLVLAFVLIAGALGWIQFSGPAILDNDGYYHIRWSRMLREHAPHLPPFQALPLTTLNQQNYVDHHFLFHVLLLPFTYGDLRIGAKLAAVAYSSLALVSLFALLVVYQVPYRWLWLMPLVASSEPFLYRMSMTRAPSLSLALLGFGAYFILQRKAVFLFFLSFIFVWAYSLFPLIVMMAAAYSVCVYLTERRFYFNGLAASILGVIAGLVINPYFPENLKLFSEHLAMKVAASYAVDVGVEWYPYDAWVLVGSSGVAFALFFFALMVFDFRKRVEDLKPLFFLLVSLVLLLMAIKSRRFIEYWPPFAILFAAFTIPLRLNGEWFEKKREQIIAASLAAIVVVALLATMMITLVQASRDVRSEADPFAYQGAALWLATHTAAGAMVFNTDWDDFPMLFYYSPKNAYVAGLDPMYLHDQDAELWDLYVNITLGRESNAAPLIRQRFGAEYVFTDNQHPDFLHKAKASGAFEIVYTDKYATVLRVLAADEKSSADKE
ncbi:MAG: hypothetical protein HY231_06640 [Acidobacteria bacterium]|nr:hypothetical protein [Acidobacteriota bacterium]